MTVAELITMLQSLNQDLKVCIQIPSTQEENETETEIEDIALLDDQVVIY
jgi:hypothetical protein